MTKKYVLLTGSTGFIGSHTLGRLILAECYRIILIVRKRLESQKVEALTRKGVIVIQGNFYERSILETIFARYPIEHVVHIAALRGGGAGKQDDYLTVNVKGTEQLCELALEYKVSRFVFISTVGVYGTIPRELPADINTRLEGDGLYHKTKLLAEQKVKQYVKMGLNACIIRPTITYGPGDNGFPSMLVFLVKKRLFILPYPDIRIHLLNVSSLAELICRILKTPLKGQQIYIAADRNPISLKRLVDLIYMNDTGRPYPCLLRAPRIIFRLAAALFQVIGNDKWLTRIKLISRNWYYDNSDTMKSFANIFPETENAFLNSMELHL